MVNTVLLVSCVVTILRAIVNNHNSEGVVWHTGKVLAYGVVGPRVKSLQGQGFCRAYTVLYQDGTLLQ